MFFFYITYTERIHYCQCKKCAQISFFNLIDKNMIYSNRTFKVLLFEKKYTLLNLFSSVFGKFNGHKLQDFAWSRPLQKCWTGLPFGHVIMIFMY